MEQARGEQSEGREPQSDGESEVQRKPTRQHQVDTPNTPNHMYAYLFCTSGKCGKVRAGKAMRPWSLMPQ